MDKVALRTLSSQAKKEALEFALEVRVFGDSLDRVGQMKRGDQFEAMKRVYDILGKRFRFLEVDMDKGTIDWDKCAPIKIKSAQAETVVVEVAGYLLSCDEAKTFTISRDQFLGDVGPFLLTMPFSLKSCALLSESTGESYVLSALFPGMKRRLGRRVSEEEGCISAMRKKRLDKWSRMSRQSVRKQNR